MICAAPPVTNLGRLGVRPDIAERLVNHVSAQSQMKKVYDQHRYLPEMRNAIEKWEAHLVKVFSHAEQKAA